VELKAARKHRGKRFILIVLARKAGEAEAAAACGHELQDRWAPGRQIPHQLAVSIRRGIF